jgi:hypothetical protein
LHGLGSSDAVAADPVTAAKAESFLFNSSPWQLGHLGAGEEPRTRISNSFPQDVQAYSKMGIRSILLQILNIGSHDRTIGAR